MKFIIFFITYQADALYSLNKFAQAEELLNSKKNEFLREKNNYYLSIIYGLLGFVNRSKKNYSEAFNYFQKSYQYDLKTKKRDICSQALYQMGKIYFEKFNQPNTALFCYYRALAYADDVDSFCVFGNIANVH